VSDADNVLALIEGTHAVADILEGFKAALIERGWSAANAEAAAVSIYVTERAAQARG